MGYLQLIDSLTGSIVGIGASEWEIFGILDLDSGEEIAWSGQFKGCEGLFGRIMHSKWKHFEYLWSVQHCIVAAARAVY